ncbi:MAG: hypothetical protein PHQ11_15995, partial [Paludibacter sp.]|nr:hypothetical protein [Paludibacter sp.]
MLKNIFSILLFLTLTVSFIQEPPTIIFEGKPDTKEDASVMAVKLIEQLQLRKDTSHVIVSIPKGRYDFYPDSAFVR